jgi:hypothetical protein
MQASSRYNDMHHAILNESLSHACALLLSSALILSSVRVCVCVFVCVCVCLCVLFPPLCCVVSSFSGNSISIVAGDKGGAVGYGVTSYMHMALAVALSAIGITLSKCI